MFQYLGEDAYSYVFDGQIGYLDHALANTDLVDQVTGVTVWHINADEPDLIDYDTSFKQPAQQAIYAPDAYRSSDHDPVIVGLELGVTETARGLKEAARDDLTALLPTGSSKDDRRIQRAITSIDRSLDPDLWLDDSYLDGKDGKKVFSEEMNRGQAAHEGPRSRIGRRPGSDRPIARSRRAPGRRCARHRDRHGRQRRRHRRGTA